MTTVLIHHDLAHIRNCWKAALESVGFHVVAVDNTEAAADVLRDASLRIDLFVTNPRLDEAALLLAIDAAGQGCPVILIAGAAWPVGIHDKVAILLEPVSDAELIQAAQSLLAPA